MDEYKSNPDGHQAFVARLRYFIRTFCSDSVAEFCRKTGLKATTVKSYLDEDVVPTAGVLYRLHATLRASPNFLILGIGNPQLETDDLRQWAPHVFGPARTRSFSTNGTVSYKFLPPPLDHLSLDPAAVSSGTFIINWEFRRPPTPRQRSPLFWPTEAGVIALFENDWEAGGERDWSKVKAIRLDAHCPDGPATIALKLKTGANPRSMTEVGVPVKLGTQPATRKIPLANFAEGSEQFDPRYVRLLVFAADQTSPPHNSDGLEVHLHSIDLE